MLDLHEKMRGEKNAKVCSMEGKKKKRQDNRISLNKKKRKKGRKGGGKGHHTLLILERRTSQGQLISSREGKKGSCFLSIVFILVGKKKKGRKCNLPTTREKERG